MKTKKYFDIFYSFLKFLIDIFLIYFAFLLSYNIRFHNLTFLEVFPVTKGIPSFFRYQQFFYLTLPIWIIVFLSMGFYKKIFLSALDELITVTKGTSISVLLMIAITFIYREYEYSRLVIGLIWVISTFLIYIWHELEKLLYQLTTSRSINVLIVGNTKEVSSIKKVIKKHKFLRPFFLFNYKDNKDILKFAIEKNIDEVYAVASSFERNELLKLTDECESRNISFKIVPDILELRLGETLIDYSLGVPVFFVKPISLTGFNFYFKRIFDILVSIVVLSILFVPLVIISILIKLDSPGPVLYYHKRMGFKGKIFKFYKFRTMVKDADVILEKIRHLSERPGPVFKMKDDPRITRIGKFLIIATLSLVV
ncbi:MAG: sugar transferase, partial [Endomicrobiia bacterium]